jgi:hypothetical protein
MGEMQGVILWNGFGYFIRDFSYIGYHLYPPWSTTPFIID